MSTVDDFLAAVGDQASPHDGYYVLADRESGRIVGAYQIEQRNAARVPCADRQVLLRVARMPERDEKYIDLITREFRRA